MLLERWVEAIHRAMDGGLGAEGQALTQQWKMPLLHFQEANPSPAGLIGTRSVSRWPTRPVERDIMQPLQNPSPMGKKEQLKGMLAQGIALETSRKDRIETGSMEVAPKLTEKICVLPQIPRSRLELSSAKEAPVAVVITLRGRR